MCRVLPKGWCDENDPSYSLEEGQSNRMRRPCSKAPGLWLSLETPPIPVLVKHLALDRMVQPFIPRGAQIFPLHSECSVPGD